MDMTTLLGNRTLAIPFQLPGAAVRITRAPFAAAVANLGGLGTIGASGLEPEVLRAEIKKAKSLLTPNCHGALGMNQMIAAEWAHASITVGIEEGLDAIILTAGLLEPWMFEETRKGGVNLIPGISRGAMFAQMLRAGIDPQMVTDAKVECGLAGGHLGTKNPDEHIVPLLGEVKHDAEKYGFEHVNLIAAGGIGSASEAQAAFEAGANIVSFGTRAFLTNELGEELRNWQDVLLDATEEDVVVMGRDGRGSPAKYPARAVENLLIRTLRREGKVIAPGKKMSCKGCLHHCLHRDSGRQMSCCIFQHLKIAITVPENDEHRKFIRDWGWYFTGAQVGEYNTRLPIEEVIEMAVTGYKAAKQAA